MEAMDFMDPRQRMRHNIMLVIGYVLVGIALLLITIILLFVAYGFGLKNGQVIQSGLVFVSTTPNPAQVYINGSRYRSDTNTKFILPEGTYYLDLKRAGYRDWSRSITIQGGVVESFAYPFLFPASLTTNTVHTFAAAPAFVSQSADHRWLLIAQQGSITTYDLYDLNNPTKAPVTLTLPSDVFSGTPQTLEAVAWASDNNHLLVKHTYDGKVEYVLINRTAPDQSVNLTRAFTLPAAGIDMQLMNNHFDHYIILNSTTHDLLRAILGTPTLQPYVANVLAFATYGDNTVVYATPDPTDAKKVLINLYDGNSTYNIRHDASGTAYLLDAANYSGDMYVAVAATSENFGYVYKNPITQISNPQIGVAVPVQVSAIKAPTYAAFSSNGEYVLFESASRLATYDAENDMGFSYPLADVVDAPQTHISWMDGARLAYSSKGQVVVFDYDGQNRQALVSADARYGLIFDQSYKFLYDFVQSAADKNQELLTSTSLRTPADQ